MTGSRGYASVGYHACVKKIDMCSAKGKTVKTADSTRPLSLEPLAGFAAAGWKNNIEVTARAALVML